MKRSWRNPFVWTTVAALFSQTLWLLCLVGECHALLHPFTSRSWPFSRPSSSSSSLEWTIPTLKRNNVAASRKSSYSSSALYSGARRLSHVMFRVPSVSSSVDFWIEQFNATLGRHSKDESTGELKGAFVELPKVSLSGDSASDSLVTRPFALELTTSKGSSWEVGNCVGGVIVPRCNDGSDNAPFREPTVAATLDPNGIPCIAAIAAAAPLAGADDGMDNSVGFVLRTNVPLSEVAAFYTTTLGMLIVPQSGHDESATSLLGQPIATLEKSELRLRYPTSADEDGCSIPTTTLIFEHCSTPIVFGNCFDHLVIEIDDTKTSIAEEYARIVPTLLTGIESTDCDEAGVEQQRYTGTLLMKPTTMFGADIMGVRDPSGHKVFLATPPKV